MKDITNKDLDVIARIKPSEFVERYCGMKLLGYQKQFIDSYPKITNYAHLRRNGKRIIQFHQMCIQLYCMKENDLVVVWTGKEQRLMNRDEFANYLMNEYWL